MIGFPGRLLTSQNVWNDHQSAVQLATSLSGAVLLFLAQLDNVERLRYQKLARIQEWKYGTKHQDEVFRTRLGPTPVEESFYRSWTKG